MPTKENMVKEGKSVFEMNTKELAEHVGNLRRQGLGSEQLEQQTKKTARASDPDVRRAFLRGRTGYPAKTK